MRPDGGAIPPCVAMAPRCGAICAAFIAMDFIASDAPPGPAEPGGTCLPISTIALERAWKSSLPGGILESAIVMPMTNAWAI